MSRKFIPNGDSEFACMARVFAGAIARDPKKYTFSDADAQELTRRVTEYREALCAAVGYRTRNPSTIFLKNEKRVRAEEIVRRFANVIRASHQIGTGDKLLALVKERPKKLRKRTVPFAAPVLQYMGAPRNAGPNSGRHLLHVTEGFTFVNKSKPNGAVRVELFVDLVAPGDPVPRFPGEFLGGRPWYLRSFTKNPIKVQHPMPPVPMLVVYWARWADAKGDVGPFSQTCVTRVEGFTAVGADKLLGAMPEVRQLERDPKQITVVTQFRERYLEGVRVEQRMLADAPDERGTAKQLESSPTEQPPLSEAA